MNGTTSFGRALAIAFSTAFVAACNGGETDPCAQAEPEYYQDPADTVLLGLDEAWISLRDAIARGVDTAGAPTMALPEDRATVSLDAWDGVYTWNAPAGARQTPRPQPSDWWDRVRGFLSPVGTAHAHGAVVNDDVYVLELYFPNDECPARVVTNALSWPIDDEPDVAARFTAGTRVEAQLTWAYLRDNFVEEGGPLRAAGRHAITLAP